MDISHSILSHLIPLYEHDVPQLVMAKVLETNTGEVPGDFQLRSWAGPRLTLITAELGAEVGAANEQLASAMGPDNPDMGPKGT